MISDGNPDDTCYAMNWQDEPVISWHFQQIAIGAVLVAADACVGTGDKSRIGSPRKILKVIFAG